MKKILSTIALLLIFATLTLGNNGNGKGGGNNGNGGGNGGGGAPIGDGLIILLSASALYGTCKLYVTKKELNDYRN